jgi:hypothetical protein
VIVLAIVAVGCSMWFAAQNRRHDDPLAVRILQTGMTAVRPDEHEWIAAMVAEYRAIEDPVSARRFARGCLWVALSTSTPSGVTAKLGSAATTAVTASALAVGVYGLIAYPPARSGALWPVFLAMFVVLLALYQLVGLQVAQLVPRWLRLVPLIAGLPGALVGWRLAVTGAVVSAPVILVAMVPPLLATIVVAKRTRDAGRTAVASAGAATTSGLFAFIAYLATEYMTGGGPRTPGDLHLFVLSGAHDYTAWAISDELAGALFLIVVVPLVVALICAVLIRSMTEGRSPART